MTTFTINEVTYSTNEKGNYFYRTTGTKDAKGNELTRRIPKHIYEQAFDEYIKNHSDEADRWDAENEVKARKDAQAKSDKAAEKAVNKKASKPRKSKDIAYEYKTVNDSVITLTAKQVDFIRHIPDTNFYENGLDSEVWCDVLADEIGGQFAGKPMTTGAMISTLREKNIVFIEYDRINGRKCKAMGFTDLGKKVAQDLGLE